MYHGASRQYFTTQLSSTSLVQSTPLSLLLWIPATNFRSDQVLRQVHSNVHLRTYPVTSPCSPPINCRPCRPFSRAAGRSGCRPSSSLWVYVEPCQQHKAFYKFSDLLHGHGYRLSAQPAGSQEASSLSLLSLAHYNTSPTDPR